jgi:hypothetical protein
MSRVRCAKHGETVLELAQGSLGPEVAVEAERLREECSHCASWWEAEFSERELAQVDAGVAAALESFAAPRRRRTIGGNSLLVAATAVLVAGILIFGADGPEPEITEASAESSETLTAADDPDLILAAGFEAAVGGQPSGWVVQVGAEVEPETGNEETREDMIFQSGLEAGGLDGWNDHS